MLPGFNIGPIPVSTFGIFLLLGFAVAVWIASRAARAVGIDRNDVVDLGLYVIIGGLVGGRLAHVLANLSAYLPDPIRILRIWEDGQGALNFYGALAGGVWVAWAYARIRRWRPAALLDLVAPAVAVGYAVAMVGALLAGSNAGRPSDVPWAVTIQGVSRHPTQLYLALASAGLYAVLQQVAATKRYSGQVFLTYLVLYAVVRAAVDMFTEGPAVAGPLTLAQLASAVVVVIAGAAMLARRSHADAAGEWPSAEPAPSHEAGGKHSPS